MARKKGVLEKDILREICEHLEQESLFFWRTNNIPALGRYGPHGEVRFRAMPRFSKKGVPDIFVVRAGILIGLEVKVPGGHIRPEQTEFGLQLEANGGHYEIVHSLEEAKYALV